MRLCREVGEMSVMTGIESGMVQGCALSVTGRSGRAYDAVPLPVHAPVDGDDVLYALRLDGLWGWVGSAADLIASPESRARFKRLSRAGAALFRLASPADPLARMTAIWDLEDMRDHPAPQLSAA